MFDFNLLDGNHELFSNKNGKVIEKFKIETPKNIWIDESICLRSRAYSFKCRGVFKNKLKGIYKYQTKHIKVEEYKKCLDGEEYQRVCNNYILNQLFMRCIFKN